MCHRQFFKIISQNPEHVDCFCKIGNNSFHSACRKFISEKNP